MKEVFSFVIFPILEVFMYWQGDYKLIMERIETISFHKDYFYFMKTHNFKFNRTNFGINFTLNTKQEFGDKLKIQFQAYKFASNEYRLFPIRLMFDVCDALSKNDWGIQNLQNCGNFANCPIKKENYTICNWAPDESKFPPYMPGGRYKSDLSFFYKDIEIATLEVYLEIKPKNRWELKK